MKAINVPVSFFEIGRRINGVGVEYRNVEQDYIALPEDSEQYNLAQAKLINLLDEQMALQDLALTMQAKSLADAAVQLGVVFDLLEADIIDPRNHVQSGDLMQDLAKFERALASATLAVADAARIELDEICEPELMTRVSNEWPSGC
jgi:hypothetical protein